MQVQCKGSGRNANVGINMKRAVCPVCSNAKTLTSAGKFQKHMRLVNKSQLRKMR